MGKKTIILAATGAIAVLASCDNTLSSTQALVSVTTDKQEYLATHIDGEGAAARYEFRVITRTENRSPGPIYLARCPPESPVPIYGVQVVGDGPASSSAYNRTWACVGHSEQIRLGPGEVRIDTLDITGPNSIDHRTQQPLGSFEGDMRIVFGVQTCPGDGACLAPRGAGASNVITVRVESVDQFR